MKVILLKDVKGSGKAGDVINAKDGYANNYLIKNGLAKPASAENMTMLAGQKAAEQHKKDVILSEAKALADKVNAVDLIIAVSVGANGKLFGAISTQTLAAELLKQAGIDIDKKKFVLTAPIKTVGAYSVAIKLHPAVTAKLKVTVK